VDNVEIGGEEMPTKRRRFTEEYKAEAVRMWRESGRPVTQVARELGLTPSALDRWAKQHKKAEALGTTRAALKAEREELQRLRRENETLRQERDFLRSAAAYFAKERK
jgi:transposase